jgi:oligosaccharide repeat unit polymerase
MTTKQNFPRLAAAIEIFGLLTLITAATVLLVAGSMNVVQAAWLTFLLLVGLVGLAWKRFDQGRHPVFFFLSLLTLFQCGRLPAWGRGAETEIFRVTLMTSGPFDVSRNVAGTVLLAIALSALAIYASCRWNYRPSPPLQCGSSRRFLPYFYWLFSLSLPVQLYKNYCYYAYARDHGGYLVFFIDHGGLAASIPLAVRAVSLISLPALVGIFVLEERKKLLRITVAVYFAVAAPVLLTGSRGAIFSLVLSLYYLSRTKSTKRTSSYALGLVAAGLLLVGALIGSSRIENGESRPFAGPAQFIADQGMSLHVTEVAVLYRTHFAPYLGPYLASELQSAFVASDQANYAPGKRFSDDVAMFLNPVTYQLGFGSGSSYIAEAYVLGGLLGVVLISAALGTVLRAMHLASRNPQGLFLVTMILPDVLWMSRGGLLDWISAAVRVVISVLLLGVGWCFYRALARIGGVLGQADDVAFSANMLSPVIPKPAGRDL